MRQAEEMSMRYKLLWKSIGFLMVFSFLAIISGCGSCHDGDGSGTGSAEENTLSVSISSPPPDYTVNQGEAVDFQGDAAGGTEPYQYLWEFGNGSTSDLKDPGLIIFETPGTYTIRLKVTDAEGLTGDATVRIFVLDNGLPYVTATDPDRGAVGFDTHAPVSVFFNEDMNPGTLTNSTFTVSAGGIQVPGTISASGNLAVFTPLEPLVQGITYTATVTTGAQDLSGNPLASDYIWTFTTVKSLAAGAEHTLIIGSDGKIRAWGSNASGQLGIDSSEELFNTPQTVRVESADWAAVSAGKEHSLALNKNGSLWAWGDNSLGQLGDETYVGKNLPVNIKPDWKWTMVSAGWYHTLAIRDDGSLWAWGLNETGQLGIGKGISSSSVPVRIDGANDWVFVAAGLGHNLAIKKDGSLWSWGANSAGQLGNNDPSKAIQYTPVLIDSGKWLTAAAGCVVEDTRSHSLAVKADGSLWSWGWNQYGQLGDRSYANKDIPGQVGDEYDWTAVSAGGRHSLALRKDGSLWAFGYNEYGQLGDESYTTRNEPVLVAAEWEWAGMAAGSDHSVGLGSDGAIFAWGRNDSGQLGNGSYGTLNRPSQISY
jgi:alpha-tubulin suppressor-like RCC1 family protein